MYYHLTLLPSLTTTSTPHRQHLPTFTHTFFKADSNFLSFPPWASALVFPIPWTVPSSCIETKDISSLLTKSIIIPPYTILYLLIFFFNGISLLASSKQKKNSPMQYHTCVLNIITSTSTRKSVRGIRRNKTFPGKFRKDKKKPPICTTRHWFEIPTGA